MAGKYFFEPTPTNFGGITGGLSMLCHSQKLQTYTLLYTCCYNAWCTFARRYLLNWLSHLCTAHTSMELYVRRFEEEPTTPVVDIYPDEKELFLSQNSLVSLRRTSL